MSGFYPSSRGGLPAIRREKCYVPTATVLTAGQVVRYVAGTGVAALATPTTFNEAIFGVVAAAHAANSGTECSVYTDNEQVYQYEPSVVLTATGGSTTTFVDSNLPNVNSLFNGGYIVVVTNAAGLPVSRRIAITGYTGATGTITFAAQTAAFAAGDTVKLYPGKRAIGYALFDLDAGADDMNFESSTGKACMIVDADPENNLLFVKFRLHQFANQVVVFA